jgi:hypothetical protein
MAGEFRKLMRSQCRNWAARKHALPSARRPLHWSADARGSCPDRCRNEGRPRAMGGKIEGRGQADPLGTEEGRPPPVDRAARAGGIREAVCPRLGQRQARRAQRWQDRKRAAEDEARRKRFTPVVRFGPRRNGRTFRRRATLLATPTFEAAQ